MKTLKELIELRSRVHQDLNSLIDGAKSDKGEERDLTADEQKKHDALQSQFDSLTKQISNARASEQRAAVMALVKDKAASQKGQNTGDDLSDKELRDVNRFSYRDLLHHIVDGKPLAGATAEFLQQGDNEARDFGVPTNGRSVMVPGVVLRQQRFVSETRAMTATGQTSTAGDQGGDLIQTSVGSLYDVLFNKMVMQELGVTMMPDMRGNLTLPRMVEDTTEIGHKAENAQSDAQSPTVTDVTLSPHRLPVNAVISKQLLLQSEAAIRAWIENYLVTKLRVGMQYGFFHGSGSNNQPLGLFNVSGIGAVYAGAAADNSVNANGAAPVWADVVGLETALTSENLDSGAYVMNAKLAGKLKTTKKDAGSGIFLFDGSSGTLNGYSVAQTNTIRSNFEKGASGATLSGFMFANFVETVLAIWGGIEFFANPYSLDREGQIRLNAATFYDVGAPRPASIAAGTDFVTA